MLCVCVSVLDLVDMFLLVVYLSSREVVHGNCSVAQLTSKGYSQHLANGHSLYEAYVKTGFLKKTLDPMEVYLRSDGT